MTATVGRHGLRFHRLAALLVAGVMTAVLGYQIAKRAAILRHGEEVLLKTRPIDPRDLLRGDYVILNYEISTVTGTLVSGDFPEDGDWVRLWVRLKPAEGGFWSVSEAAFATLPPQEGSVVLRSQSFRYYDYDAAVSDRSISVNYGIERFYVPEGEGLAIENARNDGQVSISVRVGSSGDAQIRSLLVDGEAVYDEPLY